MLISDQHKFLFVHVSKAAGSSIYRTLEPFANVKDKGLLNKAMSKTGIRRDYHKRYFAQHAYISEAMSYIPEDEFNKLFKFAFVRNPYDWIVSMYSFLQQNHDHRHNKMILDMSFADYVDFEIKRNKRHQHLFVCDKEGNLAVDFIGQFEQLEADFNHIIKTLNLSASLPHVNASSRKDFREYYTPEIQQKVAQHWHKDIALFNYQFER